MIGKGAQYLTAAGFGRYRITAASLGSLDLLGTFGWLKFAAVQAIMAAFGVDGPAVIAATNEYLNGIAASDKAKASALAGFINEDPMMVCSLGLEPQGVTMPIRWLVGDGTAYIRTTRTAPDGYKAKYSFKIPSNVNRNNGYLFGIHELSSPYKAQIVYWTGSQFQFGHYNMFPNVCAATKGNTYGIIGDWRGSALSLIVNGVTVSSVTDTNPKSQTDPMTVFTCTYGINASNFLGGWITAVDIEMADGTKTLLAPFVRKVNDADVLGMIDTDSKTFYPNANTSGSFSIEYTLPDGTPWTPPTP